MKFYSEKTKKFYDTIEDTLAAEKKFNAEELKAKAVQEEEKKRLAQLKEKRAERAKEIDELFKQKAEIENKIDGKIKSFIKDYGSYHRTYKLSDEFELIDWINSLFGII